jgi:hypothetical protein
MLEVNTLDDVGATFAQAAGDRITAENYSQHAEHYFRIINTEGNPRSRHHWPLEGTLSPSQLQLPLRQRPTHERLLAMRFGDIRGER